MIFSIPIFVGSAAAFAFQCSSRAPMPNCCFTLTASGEVIGGPVGQLGDGQNRFGSGDHPDGHYCLRAGRLVDAHGRGCILTRPTKQFQCDEGVPGQAGFSVKGDRLYHSGSSLFKACPVDAYGQFNIYTKGVSSQCQPVQLAVNGNNCTSESDLHPRPGRNCLPRPILHPYYNSTIGAPSPASRSTTSVQPAASSGKTGPPAADTTLKTSAVASTLSRSTAQPSPPAPPSPHTARGCPADLNGPYSSPWNLTYLHNDFSTRRVTAKPATYFPILSRETTTVFQFGIPAQFAGRTCSLIFTWPTKDKLQTSSFNTTGAGNLVFSSIEDDRILGQVVNARPGQSSVIATYSCPSVPNVMILGEATGTLSLEYFQDYNPEPIGLWIRAC